VPASNDYIREQIDEIIDIERWTDAYNLKFNRVKSAEIYVRPKGCRGVADAPPAVPGVKRVDEIKVLMRGCCDWPRFSVIRDVEILLGPARRHCVRCKYTEAAWLK
jgi:hypothetical protein